MEPTDADDTTILIYTSGTPGDQRALSSPISSCT